MFLDRRGGRGIKENAAKPPLTAADGVVDQPLILLVYHPVCAGKDASRHSLIGAATPPIQEGKAWLPYVTVITKRGTKLGGVPSANKVRREAEWFHMNHPACSPSARRHPS